MPFDKQTFCQGLQCKGIESKMNHLLRAIMYMYIIIIIMNCVLTICVSYDIINLLKKKGLREAKVHGCLQPMHNNACKEDQ